MIKFIPNLIPEINCNPIGCITLFLVIMSLILNFAFSPLNKRMDNVERKIDRIYDYLINKSQQTIAPGLSAASGQAKTRI